MSSAAPAAISAPQPELSVTVDSWLQAYRDGASPRTLLMRCHRQVQEHRQAGAWIYLASHDEVDRQIVALETIAAAGPDRAALIARYPLFGVPFAVKDNIDIDGVPTTAGCPAFERVATQTAGAVRRLMEAGAVWLGKTNLDQFATGLVGTRSPYGQPACVFSAQHISGGSSSGSAVTVASGAVAFSLGTDTAGSGRVPAGFNQIVGLKPTPGRVGVSGVLPACRSLDCLSVFAHTVDDAAHVLSVIEGVDEEDRYSHFEPGPAQVNGGRSGALRVGIPREPRFTPEGGYEQAWTNALEHARAIGHELVPIDFTPLHRIADSLYSGPWVAERHTVVQEMLETRPQAIDPAVRAVIAGATRFSATDAFRAQYALKESQREMSRLWAGENGVDVLMVPTAPGHPRFIDVAAEPLAVNAALGTYTNFVNLLGWCALAVPAGTVVCGNARGLPAGLPFGVTFIAKGNDDAGLVKVGRAWQHSLDLPLGSTGAALAGTVSSATPLRSPAVRESMPIAVVGAHLSGMPLNRQLLERGATLLESTQTAPHYRLYALPGTTPPKPGMVRTPDIGGAIAVEVWDMPTSAIGSFLALIPAPLALGSVELADGRRVHGFLCESHAVTGAEDISCFGGWRAYMQSLKRINQA
jgi:allophanate hydrolase